VEIDRAAADRAVRSGFALAADLAEELSLSDGLDYRVVGRAVAQAARAGGGAEALDPAALDAAAHELLGRRLAVDPGLVARALDPEVALAARTVAGGAAPEPMDEVLSAFRAAVAGAREWQQRERAAIERAERELVALARARARVCEGP
jgi:argininosuccinate lyase